MIPLHDDIPSRTTPFVNYALIALCTVAFMLQLRAGLDSDLVFEYGFIPARLTHPDAAIELRVPAVQMTQRGTVVVDTVRQIPAPTLPPLATLMTCMFLHGGWMHFLGNMWFLWIFGDNVEDRLGHLGYSMLYLATGAAAGLAHAVTELDSVIPTIGASGAIAGVMGAYAFFYPHARVLTVVPIFVFLQTFVVPAPIFLGIWFVLQLFNGTLGGGSSEGVAWWAHIGGFAAGMAVAFGVWHAQRGRRRFPFDESLDER